MNVNTPFFFSWNDCIAFVFAGSFVSGVLIFTPHVGKN